MSQAVRAFTSVGASETVVRTFNFAPGLASGETLLADPVPTCEITVIIGDDPDPQSHLINGPDILGALVSVLIGGLVEGATYQVLVDVHTSHDQLLSCWTQQRCVGP